MEGQFTQSTSTPSGLPGKTDDELNRVKEEEEMRRNLMATVLDSAARERCTSLLHSSIH
jgi:DNA-binding TFAR19-related protein (PDSD5 family)